MKRKVCFRIIPRLVCIFVFSLAEILPISKVWLESLFRRAGSKAAVLLHRLNTSICGQGNTTLRREAVMALQPLFVDFCEGLEVTWEAVALRLEAFNTAQDWSTFHRRMLQDVVPPDPPGKGPRKYDYEPHARASNGKAKHAWRTFTKSFWSRFQCGAATTMCGSG